MPTRAGLGVLATALALVFGAARPARAGGGKLIEGQVNLNTATPAELMLLPGLGPAKVRAVLVFRRRHPFRTPEELARVRGIGRRMVRELRPHLVTVGLTTLRAVRLRAGEAPPDLPSTAPPPRAKAPPVRPMPRPAPRRLRPSTPPAQTFPRHRAVAGLGPA